MSGTVELSRRTFMSGAASTALAASAGPIGTATATPSEPSVSNVETSRFDQPGSPSRKAERTFAEHEYHHYKRMREIYEQQGGAKDGPGTPTSPNFSNVVNAVKEFGVDPTGNRPITKDMGDIPEDTLVVFPPGVYLLTRIMILRGDHIGMVGAGYKQKKPPAGKQSATFKAASGKRAGVDIKANSGLFGSIVFDQTADNALMQLKARSTGFLQSRDVVWNGVIDNVGSLAVDGADYMCYLQAQNEDAVTRATRFIMKHNGIPGTKNIGAGNGFWIGSTHVGTAQIEDCSVIGNASNAIYGGRTPGNTQIKGGLYRNNEVSQNRFSGAGSWSDGVTIEINAKAYDGPVGKWGGWNDKIGTSGIQIERGDNGINKPSGAVVRNADIQVRSVGDSGLRAGIAVLGSGGALKIENTRVTMMISDRSVSAQVPGSGYAGSVAPPPHNVTITDSLFLGTNATKTIVINGRPNSLVRSTCIEIPGAGPNKSISGARIGNNVGFGGNCEGGLSARKKVGGSGPLPPIPHIPNDPNSPDGNGTTPNKSWTLSKKATGAGAGGFMAAIFGGLLGGLGIVFLMSFVLPALFVSGLIWGILTD